MFEQMKEYTPAGKLEIYHKYKLTLGDMVVCGIQGQITATFLGYRYADDGEVHSAELRFNTGHFSNYSRIKFEDLGMDTNYYPEEKRRKP